MKVGILNAYHFDPTAPTDQREYTALIKSFACQTFPHADVQVFGIALGDWPSSNSQCDIWFISGSAKSAYDEDPWIQRLKYKIKELHAEKRKLLGICFGHQIISEALGGKVEKSSKGWGVGIRSFEVVSPADWMVPQMKTLSLFFSHQDQVIQLPPTAKLLAQDPFCPNQMYQIESHILTLQGHPEFSIDFAKDRLRFHRSLIPNETYVTAMKSLSLPQDSRILRKWISQFSNNLAL